MIGCECQHIKPSRPGTSSPGGVLAPLSGYAGFYGHGLGALTPDAAVQTAMPLSSVSKTAGFTQTVYNDILASVEAGQITVNLTCNNPAASAASGPQNDLKLASTSAGLVLTGVTTGLSVAGVTTAAALAPITAGISIAIAGIVAIFSAIFNHHAAAVAKEQATECAVVPAVNNYLNIIQQAVADGTATPQQGIQALQSLQSEAQSQLASIMKNNASQCNAGCVIYKMIEAIVAYESSLFEDEINAAAAAAAAPVATAVPAAAISSTTPSLTAPAAAAVATATLPALLSDVTAAVSSGGSDLWLIGGGLLLGFLLLRDV